MDQWYQQIQTDLTHNSATIFPHLQHSWPVLGRELFDWEQALPDSSASSTQLQAEREKIRASVVAHLYQQEGQYSRATRYLAFLLVKLGRGAVIVGNPSYLEKESVLHLLPYTGLEGYYAGSEKTSTRPGISPEAILQEEAHIGTQMLKLIKKHAVEQDSWAAFVHVQHVIEGKSQQRDAIKTIQLLWETTVSQLRTRVYHNPEFELTITERIEQMEQAVSNMPARTEEERHVRGEVQKECNRLKQEYEARTDTEKEQERLEQIRREEIRAERLKACQRFRDETYHLLETSGQAHYDIDVQDSSWEQATIIETIRLPKIPARDTYPPVLVDFTPEQREGYLFLARLGTIGNDPLARSELISEEHV